MHVTVGDERFDRHYRKIRLGLGLMSHRARAQTASDWSGLTLHQLVTLRRRWMPDAEDGFRGPRPTSARSPPTLGLLSGQSQGPGSVRSN